MFDEFRNHLRSIERTFEFDFWCDMRIPGGSHWSKEVESAIEQSDVFILLTSADFIASDYIYEQEIPAIRKRHATGALVLPIILRRCAWQMIASVLQAIPSEGGRVRPIADWHRHSDGYDSARSQIAIAIGKYFNLTPLSVDWSSK